MKRCCQCGSQLLEAAVRCDTCCAEQPKQSDQTEKGAGRYVGYGCGGCLILIVAVVAIGYAAESCSGGGSRDLSVVAFVQCKNFVSDRLRSPSSADFPFLDYEAVAVGDNTVEVRSYVDSDNAFGATVRTEYACRVRYKGGDEFDQANWQLLKLQTSP